MEYPFYQVDAFAHARFAGNPAAIVVLKEHLADEVMQAVAAENNLAETAFLAHSSAGFHLRWFTPRLEVPLCGHATLATAAVVMERLEPSRNEVVFESASGPLPVRRNGRGFVLNFPARPSVRIENPPSMLEHLGVEPSAVFLNSFNYMAVLDSAETVRNCQANFRAIEKLDRPGLIITAKGDRGYDMVSRYFAPQKGIPEDPVTGAAHCMLAPYWSAKLAKTELRGYQASPRVGEVCCRVLGDRVELEGECVFVIEGMITI